MMYDDGEFVEQNYTVAFDYNSKAANTGNSVAMYRLGELYLHGNGVIKDEDKALDCFIKAGNAGIPEAMFLAGSIFLAKNDANSGFEWINKSAEAGYYVGMEFVSAMYEAGYGVEKDLNKAEEWKKKADEYNWFA